MISTSVFRRSIKKNVWKNSDILAFLISVKTFQFRIKFRHKSMAAFCCELTRKIQNYYYYYLYSYKKYQHWKTINTAIQTITKCRKRTKCKKKKRQMRKTTRTIVFKRKFLLWNALYKWQKHDLQELHFVLQLPPSLRLYLMNSIKRWCKQIPCVWYG